MSFSAVCVLVRLAQVEGDNQFYSGDFTPFVASAGADGASADLWAAEDDAAIAAAVAAVSGVSQKAHLLPLQLGGFFLILGYSMHAALQSGWIRTHRDVDGTCPCAPSLNHVFCSRLQNLQ